MTQYRPQLRGSRTRYSYNIYGSGVIKKTKMFWKNLRVISYHISGDQIIFVNGGGGIKPIFFYRKCWSRTTVERYHLKYALKKTLSINFITFKQSSSTFVFFLLIFFKFYLYIHMYIYLVIWYGYTPR